MRTLALHHQRRSRRKVACLYLLTCAISIIALCGDARAHLMPAGNGTLNFKGDGAYFVLALPLQGISEIDDNQDGGIDRSEFVRHREVLATMVYKALSLSGADGRKPLQGLLLTPQESHDSNHAVDTLTVMGRFDRIVPGKICALPWTGPPTGASLASLDITARFEGQDERHRRSPDTATPLGGLQR